MKQLFESLPQWAIALLILVAGVILLFLADPPVSVCRTQVENLRTRLTPFLFVDPKRTIKTKTVYETSIERCRRGNSPGACRELFDGIRRTMAEFETLNNECWPNISSLSGVSAALREITAMMGQIAWGEKAPVDRIDKLAWFDAYHLNTFCEIKKTLFRISSEESWNQLALAEIQKLPQSSQLDASEAWARSLYSISCAQYR